MPSINQTRVCLRPIHSIPSLSQQTTYPIQQQFHLVPLPQTNESFYFNQEPISATIQDIGNGIQAKMDLASVHLTDQRFVLLLQDHSNTITNNNNSDGTTTTTTRIVSTFQIDLGQISSLKCKLTFRCGINLSLYLVNNTTPVRIQLVFAKKDRNRREAFKEYLNMIMAGLASRKQVLVMHQQLSTRIMQQQEQLPSYDQALTDTVIITRTTARDINNSTYCYHNNNNNNNDAILPPAYSTTTMLS
ncbi:hypothetical protein INT45_013401 [Circinella minor]|uniref:Uncharacterized protein n=1 Tax=Circinella minor TaxID=1195481 RepID=A0A8H7VN21_9FUNG|nr:hypothetical protein INT45_013401 [Circinella minor]